MTHIRPSRQLRPIHLKNPPVVSDAPSPSARKMEDWYGGVLPHPDPLADVVAFHAGKVDPDVPVSITPEQFARMQAKANAHTPIDRVQVLDTAIKITTGDRQDDYGPVDASFNTTARMWSIILGHKVTPEQFSLMMIALKMTRVMNDVTKADSWIDIAGYAALGAEVAHAHEDK